MLQISYTDHVLCDTQKVRGKQNLHTFYMGRGGLQGMILFPKSFISKSQVMCTYLSVLTDCSELFLLTKNRARISKSKTCRQYHLKDWFRNWKATLKWHNCMSNRVQGLWFSLIFYKLLNETKMGKRLSRTIKLLCFVLFCRLLIWFADGEATKLHHPV